MQPGKLAAPTAHMGFADHGQYASGVQVHAGSFADGHQTLHTVPPARPGFHRHLHGLPAYAPSDVAGLERELNQGAYCRKQYVQQLAKEHAQLQDVAMVLAHLTRQLAILTGQHGPNPPDEVQVFIMELRLAIASLKNAKRARELLWQVIMAIQQDCCDVAHMTIALQLEKASSGWV